MYLIKRVLVVSLLGLSCNLMSMEDAKYRQLQKSNITLKEIYRLAKERNLRYRLNKADIENGSEEGRHCMFRLANPSKDFIDLCNMLLPLVKENNLSDYSSFVEYTQVVQAAIDGNRCAMVVWQEIFEFWALLVQPSHANLLKTKEEFDSARHAKIVATAYVYDSCPVLALKKISDTHKDKLEFY